MIRGFLWKPSLPGEVELRCKAVEYSTRQSACCSCFRFVGRWVGSSGPAGVILYEHQADGSKVVVVNKFRN